MSFLLSPVIEFGALGEEGERSVCDVHWGISASGLLAEHRS